MYISLLATNLFAYNDEYYYRTLDIDKGLSYSNVTSILADNRGVLWIGTGFGLNLYDGHDIKTYFRKNELPYSLPSSYILSLVEDTYDNIWVLTQHGLVKYDQVKDGFVSPIEGQTVEAYCYYKMDEGILFGGQEKLYLYNYEKKDFHKLPIYGGNLTSQITLICKWSGKYLLFCANGDICEYDMTSGTLYPSKLAKQLSGVISLYVDKWDNLFLSKYQKGIFIFDKTGKQKYHLTAQNSALTHDGILDMEEKEGKLWIATDGGGINIMDLDNPLSISSISHIPGDVNSLPTNSIGSLYKDKQGNMWAGSIRNGLFQIKEALIHTYKSVLLGNSYGLSNPTILSLCQDDEEMLWIGTDGGGINRFNPHDQTFIHYLSTYNEKVISVVNYSPTELIIQLYLKGVYLFNKQTGKCTPYVMPHQNNSPNRIYGLSMNRILFISNVPYIYDINTRKITYLKNNGIHGISDARLIDETPENIYLIKDNHLMRADLKTDSLQTVYMADASEVVQTACYDPRGFFWIGTERGLRRFDPKKQELEKIETNLFNRVSALILENEDKLWIGAQNALFTYNTKDCNFWIWDEPDGFSPNGLFDIYLCPITSKYIYWGGMHGLVRINKELTSIDTMEPNIQLVDFIVDGVSKINTLNQPRQSIAKITIPWNYKMLQLKVVAVDEDTYRKKMFRYSIFRHAIQNSETKVIETYSSSIPLSMLSSGEYTIHVSCHKPNGTWSTPQKILQIQIIGPWYKDYRILSGGIILLLIFLIWRILVYIHRKEEKMKWKMNEVQQIASQEKIRFLINISHELRTPLTLIHAPLKKMLEYMDGERGVSGDLGFVRKQLVNIHRSANQMKSIINMTLDVNRMIGQENTLHVYPHALNEWICSIVEEFEYEFKAKRILVNYLLDENITLVNYDDVKCESVLSNLLMNALKFSPENTILTISSQLMEEKIRISVSDEGDGLKGLNTNLLFTRFYQGEHNQLGSGIGLSYSKILIEKHGGTIGAFDNPEKGATFYFELPFQNCTKMELLSSGLSVLDTPFPKLEEDLADASFSTHVYSVVIVEDNDELRQYLTESLEKEFRIVYSASDGVEACTLIANKMPDIIISDIMMPRMDGYALCQHVKSDSLICHIPIILLTARGDKDSTKAGFRLGAEAYVPKPFEFDFLLVVLQNQLRNREMIKQKYRETFIRITENEVPLQIANSDEEFLLKFNKIVLENIAARELNVQYLTEQMGISRTPLYAKLKALTGMGVNDYINRLRIEKASELLLASSLTITEISEAVGFEYQRYFSTLFKQQKGMTPTQFRQQKTVQ